MNFTEINQIIEHYRWSKTDEENIAKMYAHTRYRREDFVDSFYAFVETFKDQDKYLKNAEIIAHHKDKIGEWFVSLFTGLYDEKYIRRLFQIGLAHVQIGLPPHYLNASFTFIREYINGIISEHFTDREERDAVRKSANKLLDINMDVINMSYREEELRAYLSTSSIHKRMIDFISRFSFALDLLLAFLLAILAVIVSLYSLYEIFQIFHHPDNVSKHVISVLGNMLILWAISELLDENIKHLRGGKFAIKIFVSVGLAAIVREILIISLSHNYTALGFMTATLLSLGIVYYLMSKSEQKSADTQKPHH